MTLDELKTAYHKAPEKLDTAVKYAQALRRAQQHESSIKILKDLLRDTPDHKRLLLEITSSYLSANQYDLAKQSLHQLRAKHPHADLQISLREGQLARQLGQSDEALRHFAEAVQIRSDSVAARHEYARQLQQVTRYTDSIDQLEALLVLRPDHFQAHILLGINHRKLGDRSNALASFRSALEHAASSVQQFNARLFIAEELRDQGQLQEAHELLTAIADEGKSHQRYGLIYLSILRGLSKQEASLDLIQKRLESAASSPVWQQALLQQYRIMHRYSEAISLCLQAREDGSLPRDWIALLPSLYLHEGSTPMAESSYQQLRNEDGLTTTGLIHLGQYLRLADRYQEAYEIFEIAIARALSGREGLSAKCSKIETLRDLGDYQQALASTNELIKTFPDEFRLQSIHISILQAQGKFKRVREVYQEQIEKHPTRRDLKLRFASFLHGRAMFAEALSLFDLKRRSALTLEERLLICRLFSKTHVPTAKAWYSMLYKDFPDHPSILLHYSIFLSELGRPQAAVQLLAKAADRPAIALRLLDQLYRNAQINLRDNLLSDYRRRHPLDFGLLRAEVHMLMQHGNYEDALTLIAQSPREHQAHQSQLDALSANSHFYLYDYQMAETKFTQLISETPRLYLYYQRLASLQMIDYRLDDAMYTLRRATEMVDTDLHRRHVPLRSHIASIINDLRTDPEAMRKITALRELSDAERLTGLYRTINEHPHHFGGSLYLLKELRVQGKLDTPDTDSNSDKIPLSIFQYWDQRVRPATVETISKSWSDHHPSHDYHFYDQKDARDYLQRHFHSEVLDAFDASDHPAVQSDYFRLARLAKDGGIYADADDLCLSTLPDDWYHWDLVIHQEDFGSLGNNFVMARAGNAIVERALHMATSRLLDYCNETAWFKTGPALWTQAVGLALAAEPERLGHLRILSVSELRGHVMPHIPLEYKKTNRSWFHNEYRNRGRSGKISKTKS